MKKQNSNKKFVGTDTVPFGAILKHKISGKEGILMHKYYVISGCCEYWIQPKGDPEIHKGFYATKELVDFVKQSDIIFPNIKEECIFSNGDKVSVDHLEVTGTIVSIMFYGFNGVHLEIAPPYNKLEGKRADTINVAIHMVQPLEETIVYKDVKPSPTFLPGSSNTLK